MMDDIVKTYTIPTKRFGGRLFRRLHAAIGKLNGRKIGRTRRGGFLFVGCSADRNEDGTIALTLKLQKRPADQRVSMLCGARKFCLYDHDDIGKLMKDLTVASAKGRRWAT